jgi:hypothetical protein
MTAGISTFLPSLSVTVLVAPEVVVVVAVVGVVVAAVVVVVFVVADVVVVVPVEVVPEVGVVVVVPVVDVAGLVVVVVVVVVAVVVVVPVTGLVVAVVVLVVDVNNGVVAFFASIRHPLRNRQSDKNVAPMIYKLCFDRFIILYLLLFLFIKRRCRDKITVITITGEGYKPLPLISRHICRKVMPGHLKVNFVTFL